MCTAAFKVDHHALAIVLTNGLDDWRHLVVIDKNEVEIHADAAGAPTVAWRAAPVVSFFAAANRAASGTASGGDELIVSVRGAGYQFVNRQASAD